MRLKAFTFTGHGTYGKTYRIFMGYLGKKPTRIRSCPLRLVSALHAGLSATSTLIRSFFKYTPIAVLEAVCDYMPTVFFGAPPMPGLGYSASWTIARLRCRCTGCK